MSSGEKKAEKQKKLYLHFFLSILVAQQLVMLLVLAKPLALAV